MSGDEAAGSGAFGGCGRRALARIARGALTVAGWRLTTEPPTVARCVIAAAPHTSIWDVPLMLAVAVGWDLELRWLGKRELFTGPAGRIFARLGGLAVDRARPDGRVAQLAAMFAKRDVLRLLIAPEGTKAWRPGWRSGFYRIAEQAGVPIVPARLDYGTRTMAFGEPFHPSGDVDADMDRLRAFFAGAVGGHPERSGPIVIAPSRRR